MTDKVENFGFETCFVLNSRKAARSLTRRCDALLREYNVTLPQFVLLASLSKYGRKSVSELAEIMVIERTALSRNLDLMVKAGFVKSTAAQKGNGRVSEVTPLGRQKFEDVYPIWLDVQHQLADLIYPKDREIALKVLKQLANF